MFSDFESHNASLCFEMFSGLNEDHTPLVLFVYKTRVISHCFGLRQSPTVKRIVLTKSFLFMETSMGVCRTLYGSQLAKTFFSSPHSRVLVVSLRLLLVVCCYPLVLVVHLPST